MKKVYNGFVISGVLFFVFLLFTLLVMRLDVQPIGPEQSSVGLATINRFLFEKLGVNLIWYHITNGLGLVAMLAAFGFGVLGMIQAIKRESLFKVDVDILLLGLFYILVMAVYILFEIKIINYRPILLAGNLEASFPSSHTMIVLCIMATAMIQFRKRIKTKTIMLAAEVVSAGVIMVTIIGRFISGVHWCTDIVAGILLGAALVALYSVMVMLTSNQTPLFSINPNQEDLP